MNYGGMADSTAAAGVTCGRRSALSQVCASLLDIGNNLTLSGNVMLFLSNMPAHPH
ncbi:hypothetical protein FHX15_006360 [Rhizobium sp. BK650]|nr:hypothetical protein [Rhizobium sp. BK650]